VNFDQLGTTPPLPKNLIPTTRGPCIGGEIRWAFEAPEGICVLSKREFLGGCSGVDTGERGKDSIGLGPRPQGWGMGENHHSTSGTRDVGKIKKEFFHKNGHHGLRVQKGGGQRGAGTPASESWRGKTEGWSLGGGGQSKHRVRNVHERASKQQDGS